MSADRIARFEGAAGAVGVALPFDLEALIDAWSGLRRVMVRDWDGRFTRTEWAYLVTFLDDRNLRAPFTLHFGLPAAPGPVGAIARPRGEVALWLPNNVSLLGPLCLVLLSLTGNSLRIKGGSRSDDLTGAFVDYVRRAAPDGPLAELLDQRVRYEVFDRQDARHGQMAAAADLRILFGSDAAARAVDGLPHPLHSSGCYFTDRRSEAWLEVSADDEALTDLLRVFAVYGQSGCTSPARVVVLDGDRDDARRLRDRLAGLWPSVVTRDPPAHLASENTMARQWAAALGWEAVTTARSGGVVACGDADLPRVPATLALAIVAATQDEAERTMPPNIQTVGLAVRDPRGERWTAMAARTGVKRLVPLRRMHHFGPVWDGRAFWYEGFEQVEVGA